FVLGEDAVTTIGTTEGATIHSSVPITTTIAKLDSEVTSADKNTKNVILVGGPAIHTLVAELGDEGKTKDVQYYRDQGEGYALVHLVNDAFAEGKAALVVAGWGADDTRTVSGFLQNFEDHADEFADAEMAEYRNGVLTTSTA
ncbi:S-layer protein, partial [Candidatus Aenigmatarchaeota archaeon]